MEVVPFNREKIIMKHLDLFSGIGGFAYAIDEVFYEEKVEHIFVEIDSFCQAVLRKHWSEAEMWGDIREFIFYLESKQSNKLYFEQSRNLEEIFILTGGFPCQPFSFAGRKQGSQDTRYLWPEMFRVIQLTKPQWIIAENVCGILTTEDGLVFEKACSDLESEDYEVQSFIIPACAVNAPHRRDRIWIIAHNDKFRWNSGRNLGKRRQNTTDKDWNIYKNIKIWKEGGYRFGKINSTSSNTTSERWERTEQKSESWNSRRPIPQDRGNKEIWDKDWIEVATEFCRVDDGVSDRVVCLSDETKISYARWRKEALKALGNAIVPQVAMEIVKAIKYSNKNKKI